MAKSVNSFLPVFIAIVVATLLSSGIWLTLPDNRAKPIDPGPRCESACNYELVETIPIGLYDNQEVIRFNSTANAWKRLMNLAKKNVEITSYYWSLLANDTGDGFVWDDSAQTGADIYNQLIELGKKKIKIGINQDVSSNLYESDHLASLGYATVRSLDFRKWFGGGVLHTKSWLIDDRHFYVGSANHDWRSLTQVKELGIAVYDCPCLAADLKKIYDVYKYMGTGDQKLPEKWSDDLGTAYNSKTPMNVRLGDENTLIYLTSSPPPFVPTGREHDGETLVRVINEAEKFVYISVMDYAPTTLYQKPNYYWPVIDDAIRHAAFDRRVRVRLLMSRWGSTRSALFSYLHSLRSLDSQLPCDRLMNETTGHYYCKEGTKGSIEIKLFEVPQYKVEIPFTRVNHAKYLVTEKTVVICISVVIQSPSSQSASKIVDDVLKLHTRDWDSSYSTSIDEFTDSARQSPVSNSPPTLSHEQTRDVANENAPASAVSIERTEENERTTESRTTTVQPSTTIRLPSPGLDVANQKRVLVPPNDNLVLNAQTRAPTVLPDVNPTHNSQRREDSQLDDTCGINDTSFKNPADSRLPLTTTFVRDGNRGNTRARFDLEKLVTLDSQPNKPTSQLDGTAGISRGTSPDILTQIQLITNNQSQQ